MTPACASIRRARALLGTFVEITTSGAHAAILESAVEQAFKSVATVDALMRFHRCDSDVSRLNREACRHPVAVQPWTWRVLETALDLHRRSAGAFDIAVAPALQRRGLLPGAMPGAGSLQRTWSRHGEIETMADGRVRFHHPGTRIDLGGIAKGFAVDRALDVLREHGVARGLVNAGGDLAVFGQPAFDIHVRDPRDASCFLCRVVLEEGALASSALGSSRSADTALSGIVEPGTGELVRAIQGATVRASTCMVADALTKIVMIAGEAARPVLIDYDADALFLSADGTVSVSDGWRNLVHRAA